MRKKLVLAYVDSLRTDMLAAAVRDGRAPTFGRLLERGVLVPDCVSSFPSVTPVACAEMVTGVRSDRHWISGMNWYHRLERRYVEYGSSFEATRAFGVFRSLYDLVYNMNLAHLNPRVETVFETLDDRGLRTACTPFLIYRGRHRHAVSLDGLMRRAVDATRLKFRHHTYGPTELFYGELYASRPVPCKPTSIPGTRDEYSACCVTELAAGGLYDFLLFSLPDNDHYSHRHGPAATADSIERADQAFRQFVDASGGLDGFLADNALILVADHAQTAVHRALPIAEELGETWHVLQPSEDRPEDAELAVSPTARAAHVYRLGPADARGHAKLREAVGGMQGVDLVCWLADSDGRPVDRNLPGARGDLTAVVEREDQALRFRPGGEVADQRGRRWELDGDPAALDAEVEGGRFASDEYPDALGRLWAALSSPHAGDVVVSAAVGYECVDWGGSAHVGGGSHGSLGRGDSLGPLLFVGCGPESAGEREQWALGDVADVVRGHFAA
ncbi:MAG TPA: alkaline phosphatase family protein [Solirubrobacterales bacterium]|nr:alkaline phosphatase family protein [Solirubrobacterales bacterium]